MMLKGLVGSILLSAALAVPASGEIVAHYTFDEPSGSTVIADSVGGVNGTRISGGLGAAGVSGTAISGLSGPLLVDMGQHFGDLPTSPDGFTLSIWVKTTSTSGMIPVSKHDAGYLNGYLLHVNNIQSGTGSAATTKAGAYVSQPGATEAVSATVVTDNQWHLLTLTYVPAGGNTSLFVDGVFQGTSTGNSYVANTADFVVGGVGERNGNNTPEAGYLGYLDDLQLYNTALSPTDIAYLFANPGSAVLPEPTAMPLLAIPSLGLLKRRRR